MKITQLSVEFKKTVSDRDYGNETVAVQMTVDVDEADGDPTGVAAVLLDRARQQVMVELGRSESLNLRRAINPPPRLCSRCHDPLPDEIRSYLHPECDQADRADRERAREAAGRGTGDADLVTATSDEDPF